MPGALEQIAGSLGFGATTLTGMLDEFDPGALPREPWLYSPAT
jgi:glutamyl-tRNA synthetase